MLRIVRLARSSIACVAFAGFGNSDRLSVSLSAPDAVASDTARKARGARSSLTASAFRKRLPGSCAAGIPRRLTIRSSRPHVVASAMCFTLRLHMSAAPPRVGLTQALGGRKAFDCFAFQCSFPRLRLALLFGLFPATLLLRSGPFGALTLRMRCVRPLRIP